MTQILIVYYSKHGGTKQLAQHLSEGVAQVSGCEAILRTVAEVSANHEATEAAVPDAGAPYVTEQDLIDCDGLLLGSATRFGNMAAPLKYFIDSTVGCWMSNGLKDKPAGLFTSSASMHGGQESTLLSMMLPLMHHGMLITGIPYSESLLHSTQSGGTPYGASHVAGSQGEHSINADEIQLARALGARVATVAQQLKAH